MNDVDRSGPVVVVGSANVDLCVLTRSRPAWGETVTADRSFTAVGGKGVNQAVAAARAGASTSFVGAVGRDGRGDRAEAELVGAGVDTAALRRLDEPTGTAHVMLDRAGRNAICVVPGANGSVLGLTASERELVRRARVVLCQFELPEPVVAETLAHARRAGVTTVLTPVPFRPTPPALWDLVDVLAVNESEAATLPPTVRERVAVVVTTLGERGARWDGRDGTRIEVPALAVEVLDTTGAGDCFAGALGAALAAGRTPVEAARFAAAAASLSVRHQGAARSMPLRAEIDEALAAAPE